MTRLDPDVAGEEATASGSARAVAETPVEAEHQRKLVRIRRSAYVVWIVVVGAWVTFFGFPFDRNRLLILICLGLLTVSIGRRPLLSVIRDWLPFALMLAAYDLSRYLAIVIGMPTQWELAPDADRALFGVMPTVWLQEHIKAASAPWWEIIISAVYMSFFLIPYVVAAFLWVRNRVAWRKYVIRFVAISFAALIGYILVPAAPPWAAARCTAEQVQDGPSNPDCMFSSPADTPHGGILGPMTTHRDGAQQYVERISTRGWDATHITAAQQVVESGQSSSNMVAAIPSLHAGLTALVALFMWPLVRRRWRIAWVGYAAAMAFALVYTAEHYVFDILIGWALAVAVLFACRPVDRWWERFTAKHAFARRNSAASDDALAAPTDASAKETTPP